MSTKVTRRRKHGEAVMGLVVRYGDGLQKRLLEVCVAPPSRRLSGGRLAGRAEAKDASDSRQDGGATFEAIIPV